MNAGRLLAHYERIADAPDAIARLRRFILDLAVRGKLVEQDPNDEPASELLKRIGVEKERLVKAGKVRKTKRSSSTEDVFLLFGSPPGWVWSRLGGISRKIHYGFTASANQNIDAVRLLRITDIQNSRVKWNSVPGCEIDEKALPNFKLETGDILIARTGGTIGKSFLVTGLPGVAVFASYLIRVQGSKEIHVRYLKLFFDSPIYWLQLREEVRGAGQPNVNGQMLDKMQVPLPPLAEQHRIVAKVDELMTLCDRLEAERTKREATRDMLASASLARLNTPDPDPVTFRNHAAFALGNLTPLTTRLDQIKALRQTILNLAVRGKLVEQDPNDEPASELLKRIAVEKARLVKAGVMREQKPLPPINDEEVEFDLDEDWQWVRMGDVIKLWNGFAFKSSDFQSEGIPVIRIGDLQNGEVSLSDAVYVSDAVSKTVGAEIWIPPNSLLIAMSGATTGKTAFNRTGTSLLLNQRVGRIEVFLLSVNFFRFFFETIIARNLSISFGTAIPNLSAQQINETVIAIPPLAEQHRIVAKVDELIALCDRLEASLSAGDDTRRRLLDALLHEALEPSEEESGRRSG